MKLALMIFASLTLCGCSPESVPTSPDTATPKVPPNVSPTSVSGWSTDSAFRLLSGVRVEILDGPQAGASVVTGDDGRFEFSGTSIGAVTLRATKDGFASETHTLTWGTRSGFSFFLEPVGPSLAFGPGDYTVTITGDRTTCDGIPDELLTRHYVATVEPWGNHPHTGFSVTVQLNNPAPNITRMGFGLGIAGNAVGFTIDSPAIYEVLPNFTYLGIAGEAPTIAPATPTDTGIAIPFAGYFEYCALRSPRSQNNCFNEPEKIAFAQCFSTKNLMEFTRR